MKKYGEGGQTLKKTIKGAALLIGTWEYVLSAYIDPLGLGKTSV